MRVVLALACLSAVTGLRQGRRRQNVTAEHTLGTHPALALKGPSLKGADCEQLSGIVVDGHDIGQAAVLLCTFWPAQFGDFPVDTATTLVDLFNGATDLWDRIQELLKDSNAPFCWKRFGLRPQLSQTYLKGNMAMQSVVTPPHPEAGVGPDSECELDVFGKCYGGCPRGMTSTTLIGSFSPVCSSSCLQSGHDTPCGFGCATGVGTCVETLMDQLSVVANAVGQVASYLSGNPLIHQVVDKVLRVVDFAIDVLFDVVAVGKELWTQWPREQIELGVIIALVQVVMENAERIGQDLLKLDEMFGETMEMVLELIDAEFDWKDINLEFIADTILKHGSAILDAAGEFAEAFVFPACEVASETNPDYDCDGDGKHDCGDWDYWGLGCEASMDRGGPCDYDYKFGDVLLDQSCRCSPDPKPAPCFDYNYDYPGTDLTTIPKSASSVEDCQSECQKHSSCQFFSFNYVNPFWNCFLKTSDAGRVASDEHTSGPRTCS